MNSEELLSERISLLEGNCQKLGRWNRFLTLTLLSGFLVGGLRHNPDLVVRSLSIVNDNGDARAKLEVVDGAGRLALMDSAGRVVVEIGQEKVSSALKNMDALPVSIRLYDRARKLRCALRLNEYDFPQCLMADETGKYRVTLNLFATGPSFALRDGQELEKLSISSDIEGNSQFRLRDRTGKIIFQIPEGKAILP